MSARGRAQLEEFEGREHKAYPDPLTGAEPWTIGVGHTGPEVHEGLVWDDEQIDATYEADIAEAEADLDRTYPWWRRLNEPRQWVVIGMCFQMGITKLRKFVNTMGAMRDERWNNAAGGMRSSLWYLQTRKRAERLARQMETGEWN